MTPLEIIGQVISIIAVLITFLTYQMRTSRAIMLTLSIATLVSCIAYALLGGTTALGLNLFSIVRNICYYHKDKKFLSGKAIPIILSTIIVILSAFLWEGYYSIFFVVGLALNTLAMGYFGPQNLRKSILLTSSLILIYNLLMPIPSIGGIINEMVAISSSVIGLIRYRKVREKAQAQKEA